MANSTFDNLWGAGMRADSKVYPPCLAGNDFCRYIYGCDRAWGSHLQKCAPHSGNRKVFPIRNYLCH